MPLTSTAESFGSFRPFPGNVGISARACEVRLRAPQADPASAAFEGRRRAVLSAGNRAPLERVGAFLLAISKNNGHEGRDPAVIPETLTCGFVAELLGFPIATLASLLKVLEERGLVSTDAHSGLRLTDLAGLEKLARA
jgi:CRP/FNR family transcriptional regulator